MENLRELYETIDRLDDSELENLQAYIEQRKGQPKHISEDAQAKIKALQEAFAEMRAGLTDEELEEIVEAMNSEYIEPLDPSEFDWLNDAQDDER